MTGIDGILLVLFGGGALVAILWAFVQSGRPIRQGLTSAVQGLCGLAAVNVVGMFSGISLGVGLLSGGVCLLLGLPGVVGLLLAQVILG